MKKLALLFFVCLFALSACNNNNNKKTEEELENAQALAEASRESLAEAIADRDSLLSLVNEINDGMDQIKELEKILTAPGDLGQESKSQREKINDDIAAIQKALQERRLRLEGLEKKLSNSQLDNSKLKETIETLKGQIEAQNAEIEALTSELGEAKTVIGKLEQNNDSLNQTIAEAISEKDAAQQEAINTANELNKCFYAIGSKSELKSKKIIESGFLKKTKIMESDFEQGFFTIADKRKLNTLPLLSKKAKVLTNHPAGSYQIVDDNGQKTLQITNSDSFWSFTNYLVIQID